ncbi:futalosine hydrolase [Sphingobacteriaceae bacterium]|nr:futalosine hydrolase [Sphingobacteriaceae bacterium]
MKKILIVGATQPEISPTIKYVLDVSKSEEEDLENLEVSFILTGVGMVNTAFTMGKLFGHKFDVVINAGVAGSYVNHKIGTVVNVTTDCFSELGAEDGDDFISILEMGLGDQNVEVSDLFKNTLTDKLEIVSGITVNTVNGNEKKIEQIKAYISPHVETMEGAAFIQCANALKWKAIQLRAISNQVEKRNKANWNMPLAIKNLNEFLIAFLKDLNKSSN